MGGEGLRERKKRLTLEHIQRTAIRLFVERGFDAVTVTEVAQAAEVAVNTVYNYFPTKESLVLTPAAPQRLARIVAERAVGVSAAGALFAHLRTEIGQRDGALGLYQEFPRVLAMMLGAPTLAARLNDLGVELVDVLAAYLAEEVGAPPGDLTVRLVAGQIGWVHALVFREIGVRTQAGDGPDAIAEGLLLMLEAAEALLGDRVLNFATREAGP
ncbi:AcrR family transcriptional regulator [Crossiella equi]|uniref:AcrR family transcriptional regulator n=1 Tax=Crossiella equi TaxID=130796 RepID=A0ABS5A3S3_9PSEU|nr:TetR family transcriptional regulator [Crossiella equi]MBP2471224.1 AcrR family transcriptional regulator [Crossiella equi]